MFKKNQLLQISCSPPMHDVANIFLWVWSRHQDRQTGGIKMTWSIDYHYYTHLCIDQTARNIQHLQRVTWPVVNLSAKCISVISPETKSPQPTNSTAHIHKGSFQRAAAVLLGSGLIHLHPYTCLRCWHTVAALCYIETQTTIWLRLDFPSTLLSKRKRQYLF